MTGELRAQRREPCEEPCEYEEKGEECPLRLHSIDSNNAENLAGPPLIYGHRYHTFCL